MTALRHSRGKQLVQKNTGIVSSASRQLDSIAKRPRCCANTMGLPCESNLLVRGVNPPNGYAVRSGNPLLMPNVACVDLIRVEGAQLQAPAFRTTG
jgi:hypothetical protein